MNLFIVQTDVLFILSYFKNHLNESNSFQGVGASNDLMIFLLWKLYNCTSEIKDAITHAESTMWRRKSNVLLSIAFRGGNQTSSGCTVISQTPLLILQVVRLQRFCFVFFFNSEVALSLFTHYTPGQLLINIFEPHFGIEIQCNFLFSKLLVPPVEQILLIINIVNYLYYH